MSNLRTLEGFLVNAAAQKTGVRFIESSSQEEFMSYEELYTKAVVALGFLQNKGISRGDEVIFQLEDNKSFLISFWGCVLGGIIPVPINPAFTPETRSKLINVWNTLHNPHILTEEKAYSSFGPKIHEDELKNYNPSHLLHFEDLAQWEMEGTEAQLDKDDIAFIQFSSGSTGSPKGVTLTHENLIINIKAIASCSDLGKTDSTLGWMPLTHDLGLIGFHLTPVLVGINQFLIPTNVFIRRPSLWITKINEHRVTFTASPNFGYKHFLSFFKEEAAEGWELSCVRRILNGAEPISADLCGVFLSFLSDFGLSPNAMFPVYGMAEASLAVAFPEPGKHFSYVTLNRDKLKVADEIEIDENGVSFVCVGTPVDNCQIRISSDNFIPLEEDRIGHIEIKGGNVTKGYYNNEEANKQTFTSGGWLRTGDLGFFKDGKLYITGRSKDIIFSNGQNIYPHDIERITEEVEGVDLGKVVVCGVPNEQKYRDEVLAFIFFKGKPEDFVDLAISIKSHVNRKLSLELDAVLPVKSIEKTTSGKVKRFHYAEEYKQGTYEEIKNTIHELTLKKLSERKRVEPRDELERELFLIWAHILGRNDIGIHENFFELGGNSMKANLLLGRISKILKIELSIREVFKSPTIASIATIIKDKKEQSFTSIPAISERQFYPCSSTQKRLFFLNRLNPESLEYNITCVQKIPGQLDYGRLGEVFNLIVQRHQVLRTYFDIVDGEPIQRVKDISATVQIMPFVNSVQESIKAFVKPFDILTAPLFRIGVVRDKEQNDYLIFDLHHIISDGYSMSMIIKEFSDLYSGEEVKSASTTYLDYAVWEAEFLKSTSIIKQKEFWLSTLSGELPSLNFPTDNARGNHVNKEGAVFSVKIDENIHQKLTKLAEYQGVTYYMLFVTALNIALAKYSQQEDIIIGSPIANRPHNDLEFVFGPFINTLPLRNYPSKDKTIERFIHEVKENIIDAIGHQNYPFEKLVEELELKRDTSRNALFDVLFTYQNLDYEEVKIPGQQVTSIDYFNGFSRFDIALDIFPYENYFTAIFEYSSRLFDQTSISQFAHHFLHTLELMTENVHETIANIQLLNEQEKQKLIGDYCGTFLPESLSETIVSLFASRAAQHGDQHILFHEDKVYSYRHLDNASNAVANALISKGLQVEQVVGIMLPRGVEFIISMLGIMKAGGAYLPIDINYPQDRIAYVIEDSNAPIVITNGDTSSDKFISYNSIDIEGDTSPIDRSSAEGIAYLIYTSGSTGNPKGVAIEHRNVVSFIDWAKKDIIPIQYDVLFAGTSFSFDLSVFEMFVHLSCGVPIRLLENGLEIPTYLDKHQNIMINSVPSVINDLVSMETDFTNVKSIIMCGEPVPQKVKDGLNLRDIKVLNLYGPSEDTVYSTIFHIEEPDIRQIIGTPLDGTKCYVVDEHMQLVPKGVAGELLLSGAGLARGYYGKDDITNEKFLKNPFSEGERVYRTGDLVRWNKNGNLEFLGRIDAQVKIRGHRIELGEIESRLLQLSSIKEAAATVKEIAGDKHICAYYTVKNNISVEEIKTQLKVYLPDYMIPSFFTEMMEMPETANGKIDKKALPEPEIGGIDKQLIAPSTETEIQLSQLWANELNIAHDISITDSFFDLGGHSLKAAVVISKVQKQMGVEVSLRDFFTNPTIRDLALIVDSKEASTLPEIKKVPVQEMYEVSAAQKRMYILNKVEGDTTSYNMPGAFLVEGSLDVNRLQLAFEELIKKHESLRTSFEMRNEQPFQVIHNSFSFHPEMLKKTTSVEAMVREFIRPFDLSKAPLFRVGVYKESGEKHLLVFDMHHIISDGVSISILIKDFVAFYDGLSVSKLSFQYKDYAAWHNKLMRLDAVEKQKEYWINQFIGELPVLELPTDFERPKVQRFDGASYSLILDTSLTNALKKVSKEEDVTLFMMLIALYNIFLSKQTGQQDFIVGTPVAGRNHHDLQDMIGVFVNTLAIRTKPNSSKTIKKYLSEVKETAIQAFDHQDYPFDALIDKLDIERVTNRNPVFDTMLAFQNMDEQTLSTVDLTFSELDMEFGNAKFDLTLFITEKEGALHIDFNYCTKLFTSQTIERFAQHFTQLAEAITKRTDIEIGDLDVLSSEEKNQIVNVFNNTQVAYGDHTILDDFRKVVAQNGAATAVIFEGEQWSFTQLDEASNQFANYLLYEAKRSKGNWVALYLERSEKAIISILGTLKAGLAYVPIDTSLPLIRVEYILKNSGSTLLITDQDIDTAIEKIDVRSDWSQITNSSPNEVEHKVVQDDIAYMIYTSGSTGQPKGCKLTHGNLHNYTSWSTAYYFKEGEGAFGLYTSLSFDLTISSIFCSLLRGKPLYIYSSHMSIDDILKDSFSSEVIDAIKITPAHISLLKHLHISNGTIKVAIVGGDRLTNDQVEILRNISPGIRIYNEYGPTEATVGCIVKEVQQDENIVIGKPIANTEIFIMREEQLVPIGVVGEIWIAGNSVGVGYHDKEDLTAEKFVHNPFSNYPTAYRTGDLARWLPDGNIDFLGRIDHQVKVRGYRIELEEIEDQLQKYTKIKDCVIADILDEDTNEKFLAAYYVSDDHVAESELRTFLSETLPAYMIPSFFVNIDEIPTTSNGKVNKKALPYPSVGADEEAITLPVNEIQEQLLAVWKDVLNTDNIGINSNFFSLGGDSIKAIQVASRLQQINLKVEVKQFFASPTIAELAPLVKQSKTQVPQEEVTGNVELSPIQYHFFAQSHENPNHYNQSVLLHSTDRLDIEKLESSLHHVTAHHDILRAAFDGNGAHIQPATSDKVKVEVVEMDDASSITQYCTTVQASLNIAKGDLAKYVVFRRADEDLLFIVVHHLVIDGVSWRVIIEDIQKAYFGDQLPFKTHSFKHWTSQLADFTTNGGFEEDKSYWETVVSESQTAIYTSDEKITVGSAKTVSKALEEQVTKTLLGEANVAYNTDVNDLLLSALAITFNGLNGQKILTIALEGHGREEIIEEMDISRTVGWFTSLFPVNLKYESDLRELIVANKDNLHKIPNKGMGYGVLKYLGNHPLDIRPQIVFNYLGAFENNSKGIFSFSDIEVGAMSDPRNHREHPLEFNLLIQNGELVINFTYDQMMMSVDEAHELLDNYVKNLTLITDHCMGKEGSEITISDVGFDISSDDFENIFG